MTWDSRWLERLPYLFDDTSQMAAGRALARKARPDIELEPGSASARFVDRRSDATATIALRPFDESAWVRLVAGVVERPALAAAVLTGELPVELEQLGDDDRDARLLPRTLELRVVCSCESWAEPCVHGWAVLFGLAELIKRDPNVLLLLRNRTRQHLVEPVRSARGMVGSAGPTSHQPRGADRGMASGGVRRTPEPLPRPLPPPWRPATPPLLPMAPPVDSGVELADLAAVMADGAIRALALLNGEGSSGLHHSVEVDLVRRAAASPAMLLVIAEKGAIDPSDLERRAIAWRHGGLAALAINDQRWEAPEAFLAQGLMALPGARQAANTLTAGRVQLRVDPDQAWWRFDADERLGWLLSAGGFDDPADALD